MNMNKIIKLFLLLNNCFLASNITIEKCAIWNKISKCFRVSANNTHCYETKPNGTFCCSDTLNINDFSTDSEINLEKCIIYNEVEEKLFVLLMALLIYIVIGIIIKCYWCADNCVCGEQDDTEVLRLEDIQTSPMPIPKEGEESAQPLFGSGTASRAKVYGRQKRSRLGPPGQGSLHAGLHV